MKRIAVATALLIGSTGLGAQTPSLGDVLKAAATYVEGFHKQLSGISAEESYTQQVSNPSRVANNFLVHPKRQLKSELLLVKPGGGDRYVELRDVFEVDGQPVRDRESRLERLLRDPSAAAGDQMRAIINESARYNIGNIIRNVNTPLLPLVFLDRQWQSRFAYKRVRANAPVLKDTPATLPDDTPVFRVSTEMWAIEYQERKRDTVIKTPAGRDLPVHGRFWINPSTGAVLISELIVEGGGVVATITVSYQSEPLLGFLVPVEMRESYIAPRERVDGRAVYGRFRQIQ